MPTRRRVLAAVSGLAGTTLAGCPERRRQRGPVGGGDARVGFVGDAMLGRSVDRRWREADPAGVWGTALERLRGLDGLVANLECCIADGGRRWPDKTYYFRATPAFARPALRVAGVSAVTLANNHTLDFGATALRETRTHLDGAGVSHTGAGPDREAAFAPAVVEAGGLRVAVVGLTDRMAAYAAGDGPGTAYLPLDPANPASRARVAGVLDRARARDPDLLVASLHWGPNWETTPDPGQRAFARWLVDRGVDVVHGHSAHVLQGIEVYRGRPILYDTGDVVDDYLDKAGYRNKRSGLFELVVRDGRLAELRVVPLRIADEQVGLAGGEAAAWVRRAVRERSAALGTRAERAGAGLSVSL
jgi:poly-gamma-glutamate synthesis protein (capsule biosynthesis protein)